MKSHVSVKRFLVDLCGIDKERADFIVDGKESADITKNAPFNLSDLTQISKVSGLSVEYLLTGNEEGK